MTAVRLEHPAPLVKSAGPEVDEGIRRPGQPGRQTAQTTTKATARLRATTKRPVRIGAAPDPTGHASFGFDIGPGDGYSNLMVGGPGALDDTRCGYGNNLVETTPERIGYLELREGETPPASRAAGQPGGRVGFRRTRPLCRGGRRLAEGPGLRRATALCGPPVPGSGRCRSSRRRPSRRARPPRRRGP